MLPALTLVLGGAASGKSAFAEDLVLRHCAVPGYIATAQAFDAEMEAKIARHRDRRGALWVVSEAPMDLVDALLSSKAETILIDCATLWLSNLLLAERDVDEETETLLASLSRVEAHIVIVSNEVGQGIVPDTALGRSFREAQGRLNIALAARAGLVVQVVAGLPNVLKGGLP